jgi:hypothetical protein
MDLNTFSVYELNTFQFSDLNTLDPQLPWDTYSANVTILPCTLTTLCRVISPYISRNYLCVLSSALKGILEKVWIKTVYKFTYKDTLNRTWNKFDLIPYEEAIILLETQVTVYAYTITASCKFMNPLIKPNYLYVKDLVLQGIMEKVWIKRVFEYDCEDTLNRIWNKDDLISYEQAKVMLQIIAHDCKEENLALQAQQFSKI